MENNDAEVRERVEEFRNGLEDIVEDTPEHMDRSIPVSDLLDDLNSILDE